jgi:diguanylate cyclase (GGDEF)-like protein
VVFFILCVAILNLGLGYGLALYLHGYGGSLPWPSGFDFPWRLKFLSFGKDPDEEIDETAPVARPPEGEQRPLPSVEAATARVAPADDSQPPVSLTAELPTANVAQRPSSPESGSTPAPVADLTVEVDDRAIAAAIEGLKIELGRYRGEITTLDARLRDCSIAPDEPTVRSCAEKLRKANHHYLEQQESHRGRLSADAPNDEASSSAVRGVLEAADRQAAIVASVQTELAAFDPEANLLAECEKMLGETRHISQTTDELYTAIGAALAAIAPKSLDMLSAAEPAAIVAARREFVARIEDWWRANPAASQRLSLAMIDPDHLGRLNEQHGRRSIDQALDNVERIVARDLKPGQQAIRPSGQSHLLFLPGIAPREAVNVVERCRQEIDATRFRHGDQEFRITVSCAVAEAQRGDDAGAVVARLEAMLNEAKRYGRNRTFFQEGNFPAPAVPPAMSIERRVVQLDAAVV